MFIHLANVDGLVTRVVVVAMLRVVFILSVFVNVGVAVFDESIKSNYLLWSKDVPGIFDGCIKVSPGS